MSSNDEEAASGVGDGVAGILGEGDDPHGGTEVLFIRHAESRNNVLHAEVGKKYNFDPKYMPEMEQEVAALRSEDADLSQLGYQQAETLGEYLAERLKGKRVLVVTSPMQRAIKTILPTVKRLGLGPDTFACYGHYFECGVRPNPKAPTHPTHPPTHPTHPPTNRKGCYKNETVYKGTPKQQLEETYQLTTYDVHDDGWYAYSDTRESHAQALLRCESAWLWIHDLLLSGKPSHQGGGWSKEKRDKEEEEEEKKKGPWTLLLVGHGEFMCYLLKKMVGGGHLSSALGFVHGNTGISTCQYHPDRGLLCLNLNSLAHLPPALKTGHTLADGWWEVVPRQHHSVNSPLIHRFESLPEEDPDLYLATQAIRRRYLHPPSSSSSSSLHHYQEHVDQQAVHFLALAHGQSTVVGVALYDPSSHRLRQVTLPLSLIHPSTYPPTPPNKTTGHRYPPVPQQGARARLGRFREGRGETKRGFLPVRARPRSQHESLLYTEMWV